LQLLRCCSYCFVVAAVAEKVVEDREETKKRKTERRVNKQKISSDFIHHSIKERRKRGDRKKALFSLNIHHPKQDTCNSLYRHTSTTSHYK